MLTRWTILLLSACLLLAAPVAAVSPQANFDHASSSHPPPPSNS